MSVVAKIDVSFQMHTGILMERSRIFTSVFGFAACFMVFKLLKLAASSCFSCRLARVEAVLSAV